MKAIKHVLKDL